MPPSMSRSERLIPGVRLHPEIPHRVLPLAERLSGRPPRIQRALSLPNDVRAMLVHPTTPQRPCEIRYAKGQELVLEHLIAHEVGHIVRLHQVPEAERLMPVMSAQSRWHAVEQITGELAPLEHQGLSAEQVVALFVMWHEALCTQLGSFPADLRIEAWVHEQFPGLRPIQRRSLLEEVARNGPMFDRRVVALTPRPSTTQRW